MKMTVAHFEKLFDTIKISLDIIVEKNGYTCRKNFLEAYRKAIVEEGKAKDIDMRVRWDLVSIIPCAERTPLFDEFYKYLNDNHIDSALKKVVRSLLGDR